MKTPEQQTPEQQTTELTINLPTSFEKALQSLAESEGLTADALIMRSLGLYSMAIQAETGKYALSFTRIKETNDLTVGEIIRIEDEPEPRIILPR